MFLENMPVAHMSAVLHALVAMTTVGFQVQPTPSDSPLADEEDETLPVTSYLCQWKVPRKRKESNLQMSGNAFEKHDYCKPKKRRLELTEDFDPRPENLRGNANSLLPGPLDSVHGESLGISLLFDQHYCHTTAEIDDVAISDIATLKHSILSFKESCLFMKSRKSVQTWKLLCGIIAQKTKWESLFGL